MLELKRYLKKVSRSGWILLAIIAVGIFLRTYRLDDWLYFYPDQARDVSIIERYVNGKAPLPLLGFKAASTNFQLGAMYYYFQIISAKIFGATPSVMAYPDVFFGIMSIPLLYYFLKRYFDANISLALTGLYSISFYAIRYSRFAWNTNPIPFFVLLFMLAMLEFLCSKKKTSWKWIVALGVALGVGVQLHTVLLILLPLMLLGSLVYFLRVKMIPWQKFAAILVIALFLNTGQVISELNHNFKNTRYFFSVLSDRSPGDGGGILGNVATDVICHAQANVLYLTSLENNDNCDSLSYIKNGNYSNSNNVSYLIMLLSISFGLFLFGFGYWALAHHLRQEQDEKKRLFLGLNLVYGILTFFIILPIVGHNGQVRYWLPVIFLPFLFLGLLWRYYSVKISQKYHWVWLLIVGVIGSINLMTIAVETNQFAAKTRSNAQYVVLDELRDVNAYIIAQSSPQQEAYIFGGQKYMQNFFNPLSYVASENKFNMIRGGRHPEDIPKGEPIFYIDQNPDDVKVAKYFSVPSEAGLEAEYHENFGNIVVYKIKN